MTKFKVGDIVTVNENCPERSGYGFVSTMKRNWGGKKVTIKEAYYRPDHIIGDLYYIEEDRKAFMWGEEMFLESKRHYESIEDVKL